MNAYDAKVILEESANKIDRLEDIINLAISVTGTYISDMLRETNVLHRELKPEQEQLIIRIATLPGNEVECACARLLEALEAKV